jgi:hypothetical protein
MHPAADVLAVNAIRIMLEASKNEPEITAFDCGSEPGRHCGI